MVQLRNDNELMEACRSGNEQAWADFYARFAPRIARFLYRVAGPNAEVEELVQQVFVECFTSLDRFRGEAPVTSWLFGIAANLARRHQRSATRNERKAGAFGHHLELVGERNGSDPSSQVAARDAFGLLEGALERLKPPQRIAWVMVELEGMTCEDVARTIGARPSTVRARLRVARERIRKTLALQNEPARVAKTAEAEVVTR